MTPLHGLARAREICQDRSKRVRELHEQGTKIIGHYCCHVPREIMTAAGMVPLRITGDVDEPITEADNYLETIMCPYIRSTVDLAFKGRYEFLDGLIVPHTCDSVERMGTIWSEYLKTPFYHFLNVPHMAYPDSTEFFGNLIDVLKQRIEEFAGQPLSDRALADAIALHNENRALTKDLYALKKQNPPLITGHETLEVVLAGMVIPVDEHNQILREVIAEVKTRQDGPKARRPRIMVYASELDSPKFIDLVEDSGGYVVMDDMCIGTRAFWDSVTPTANLSDGLAAAHLDGIRCPRTFRPNLTPQQRFQYLVDYAREFDVDGVVLFVTRFCDTHEFDVPDVRDVLQSNGFPVLHLTHEYSVGGQGQFRTRIEAFLETL